MTCKVIGQDCKLPGERIPLRIPLSGPGFIRYREASKIYAAGVFIRPVKPNGYEYEVTGAGQTGRSVPELPTTIGAPVDDGSAVLTCRALSNSSLIRIPTAHSWTVTPSGPTIDGEQLVNTNGEGESSCFFAGGTSGTKYTAKASITFDDGSIEEGQIEVTVD